MDLMGNHKGSLERFRALMEKRERERGCSGALGVGLRGGRKKVTVVGERRRYKYPSTPNSQLSRGSAALWQYRSPCAVVLHQPETAKDRK